MLRRAAALLAATTILAPNGSVGALELFAGDEHVVVVDKASVATKVLGTAQPVLFGAFSDSAEECPGCVALAGEFKKAAEYLAGYGVMAAVVDCTGAIPKCHGLTQSLRLTHFPAVHGYVAEPARNPYTKKSDREKILLESSSTPTARTLQKLITNKIPSVLLPRQTGASWPPKVSTAAVLLFTDRDASSPLFKSLAYHYLHRLTFAEVHKDDEALKEKYAVSNYPTMLVTFSDAGHKDDTVASIYKGDLKSWAEMTAFLDAFASESPADKPDAKADGAGKVNGKGDGKAPKSAALVAPVGSVALEPGFMSRLKASDEAWLVLYHTLGDDAEWAEVAKKCEHGLILAGEVNCTAQPAECAHVTLKKGRAIEVLPYGPDKGGDALGGLEVLYSPADAYEAANEAMPDTTHKVNAMTLDALMVEAVDRDRLVLCLISTKGDPPAMLKQLALTLGQGVDVAFFPDPDPQTLQRFQVTRTPLFLALFGKKEEAEDKGKGKGKGKEPRREIQFGLQPFDPKMYGRPTYDSVFGFAVTMLQQLYPAGFEAVMNSAKLPGAARANANAAPAAAASAPLGPMSEVTAATWAGLCKPTSATLCAIAFLAKGSPTFVDQLAVAEAAAAAHAKDPFVFMWADGNCLLDFANAFDVQPSKLPTLVAYSPKKNRFASFMGVYGTESISDLLTGVLSGRIKTKPLFQAAIPEDKTCAAEAAVGEAEVAVEEESLGDFMAEILAEEAKKKAQMKAEVAAEAEAAKKAAAEAEAAAKAPKKKIIKKKKPKKDNEL
jgi:protein disulfide-isomerase A6